MSLDSIGEFDLESYQFYIKHASKHEGILASIKNVVENWGVPWVARLRNTNSEFRFLDVGSGPGQLTGSVLRILLNARGTTYGSTEKGNSSSIIACCVDPNEEAMDLLEERLANEQINASGTNIRFIREEIETWFDQNLSSGSIPNFDLILCSHTLYYIADWSQLLDDLMLSLMPGGQLCIVLVSKETQLFELREQLIPKIRNRPLVRLRFAEDVESSLQHKGIPYIMEIKESAVTFSAEETEAFYQSASEEIDPVMNVLGFLFGYDPLNLKCEEMFPTIEEFAECYTQDEKLSLLYKDKIFWITKE